MPETYYYATGTEVTSIADAIRTKGGTSQALTFPDDFVEAIEDLHPEPTIAPLTVIPKGNTYKHPIGYETIDYVYISDVSRINYTSSIDLSRFSNGDVCYVKGILYVHTGTAQYQEDLDGSFIWSDSNIYKKGIYTLTITTSSITITTTANNGYLYASNNSEIGYRLIGFCKKIDSDGFGPVEVSQIPNGYINVSNITATAADIVSGKTAGIKSGNYGIIATGTLVIQHYYTGSTDPSSSLGENGDIYLKT